MDVTSPHFRRGSPEGADVNKDVLPVVAVVEESERSVKQPEQESRKKEIEGARVLDERLSRLLIQEHLSLGEYDIANKLTELVKEEGRLRELPVKESFSLRNRHDCDWDRVLQLEAQIQAMKDRGDSIEEIQVIENVLHATKVTRSEVAKLFLGDDKQNVESVFKSRDGEAHIFVDGKDIGTATDREPRGHLREWLAGFVAKVLGASHIVPSTIIREVDGKIGSLQAWVDGQPISRTANWGRDIDQEDLQYIAIIDWLLKNGDRHRENFFVGEQGHAYAIDHGFILPLRNAELRSYPLRFFSNQDISSNVIQTLTRADFSDPRLRLLEEAFVFVFGKDEQTAKLFLREFKKCLAELVEKKKFPDYVLPFQDEEDSFAAIAEKAHGKKQKKARFNTTTSMPFRKAKE